MWTVEETDVFPSLLRRGIFEHPNTDDLSEIPQMWPSTRTTGKLRIVHRVMTSMRFTRLNDDPGTHRIRKKYSHPLSWSPPWLNGSWGSSTFQTPASLHLIYLIKMRIFLFFFYSSDGLKRALEKRINSGGNLVCSEVWWLCCLVSWPWLFLSTVVDLWHQQWPASVSQRKRRQRVCRTRTWDGRKEWER